MAGNMRHYHCLSAWTGAAGERDPTALSLMGSKFPVAALVHKARTLFKFYKGFLLRGSIKILDLTLNTKIINPNQTN